MIIDGTKKEEEQTNLGGSGNVTPANTGASANSGRPTSSGRWTNLTSYINQNRGGGQKVASSINQETEGLNNQYKQYQGDLKNQYDRANAELSKTKEIQDFKNYALENPLNVSHGDERLGKDVENKTDYYSNLNSQKQKLQGEIDQKKNALGVLGTTGGLREYLQKQRGNRAGSAGGLNLDEFVASQDTATQDAINNSKKALSNIESNPMQNYDMNSLKSLQDTVSSYDPNSFQQGLKQKMSVLGSFQSLNKPDERLQAPVAPSAPERPTVRPGESSESYDNRMRQYNQDITKYNADMNLYNQRKAEFESNLFPSVEKYNQQAGAYNEQLRMYNALARLAGQPELNIPQYQYDLSTTPIPDAPLVTPAGGYGRSLL